MAQQHDPQRGDIYRVRSDEAHDFLEYGVVGRATYYGEGAKIADHVVYRALGNPNLLVTPTDEFCDRMVFVRRPSIPQIVANERASTHPLLVAEGPLVAYPAPPGSPRYLLAVGEEWLATLLLQHFAPLVEQHTTNGQPDGLRIPKIKITAEIPE